MGLRLETKGAAVISELAGASINSSALSFQVADATGWPDGLNGKFTVTLGRNTASEERILCDSRTGTTITVNASGRGYDGTTASAHNVGDDAEHTVSAKLMEDANKHHSDIAIDDHTQYMKADGTRHDLTARHAFGAALGTPGTPANVATAASAGSGAAPAREDHVHDIADGAIDHAGLFVAGVVDSAAIAADAVGTSEIAADAVTSSELADNAVDTNAIQNLAVTTGKLALDAVTGAQLADDAVSTEHFAAGAFGLLVPRTELNQAAVDGVADTAARSDHWHHIPQPLMDGRAASAGLNVSTTPTDIPGATQTITTDHADAFGMAWAIFDVDFTGPATNAPVVGEFLVDGVALSGQMVCQLLASHPARLTLSQMWLLDPSVIGAGTHTMKLRAYFTVATLESCVINATHTKFHFLIWD